MKIIPPVPEKKIFKGFYIYGRGGHFGHVTWAIYTNFGSPYPRRLHIKFGFDWPSGFRGRRRTDGRRLDGYTISSPCEPNGSEPNGSGELKRQDRVMHDKIQPPIKIKRSLHSLKYIDRFSFDKALSFSVYLKFFIICFSCDAAFF